ncbi:hypothetical protein WA1_22640 [Scytonema hofmannii PCC 7110]|uniref:Bacteriocin n=1 Tax=Scytonema hofmannii PCC 7110 TaxID=128403 RepID=A0A139X9B5_9CYAN|nr:hypothetical protein [Scytonema hofmannii]KYC41265.1 hypothetical protein WA1_22640 [Scytonema hofmannii PCC 7110]
MANINISDLNSAGSELFHDSETFLDQLTEREILDVQGGLISASGIPTLDLLSGLAGGLPSADLLAGLPSANILFPPAP